MLRPDFLYLQSIFLLLLNTPQSSGFKALRSPLIFARIFLFIFTIFNPPYLHKTFQLRFSFSIKLYFFEAKMTSSKRFSILVERVNFYQQSQELWLSGPNGRFRYRRSAVQSQSSAPFYTCLQFTVDKTKIMKKRPGMAHKQECFSMTLGRSSCLLGTQSS